jgi:hypothetical protein
MGEFIVYHVGRSFLCLDFRHDYLFGIFRCHISIF